MFFFFFFKQKTAYEMCGRDWSSDVCSSDLGEETRGDGQPAVRQSSVCLSGAEVAHYNMERRRYRSESV